MWYRSPVPLPFGICWTYLGDDRQVLDECLTACIGPITAATARELGLTVDIVATEHNVEGLADALVNHFTAAAVERAG